MEYFPVFFACTNYNSPLENASSLLFDCYCCGETSISHSCKVRMLVSVLYLCKIGNCPRKVHSIIGFGCCLMHVIINEIMRIDKETKDNQAEMKSEKIFFLNV